MRLTRSRFTCLRDGLTIRGYELRPAGERLPAVVLCHGFGTNHVETEPWAKKFAEMGYAAYTFDFNGGGPNGASDGKTTEMSVLTEKEDLKAVISYVSALRYTDNSKLTLLGVSQGGFVSALAAAELSERVKRLILISPAFCIPDDARAGKMQDAAFDPADIPETFRSGRMKLGRRYAQDVMQMNPFAEIRGYRGPVLIVHGTADPVVNAAYAKQAWKTYTYGDIHAPSAQDPLGKKDVFSPLPVLPAGVRPHRYVQLLLVPGAGHGFYGKPADEVFETMRYFLDGYAEIFTLDVMEAGKTQEKPGVRTSKTRKLTGAAASPYLTGTITEESRETQEIRAGVCTRKQTHLVLSGKDYHGSPCQAEISVEEGRLPLPAQASTASRTLSYINGASCVPVRKKYKGGELLRVYIKAGDKKETSEEKTNQ